MIGTFSQWNKTRPLRPVTWACGPEEVLRREVIRHFYESFPDSSKAAMWPEEHEDRTWSHLLGAAGLRGRVTIVYGAAGLRLAADRLPVLLDSIPDGHFVVFNSGESDFTRAGDTLAPHLEAIRKHKDGQLVRCCRPSKEEELLKLIASWWPGAGPNHAWKVWRRCEENLTASWQVCDTARRSKLPPDQQSLGYLVPLLEPSHWADAVMGGNRREAMAVMPADLPGQLRALGELNATLGRAVTYARLVTQGRGPDEIARRGVSRYHQRLVAPYAGRYDAQREMRCRKLLALGEDALRSGARWGVLEAVAANW